MSAALALRPAWGIQSYLAVLVLAVALPAGGLIAYGIYDAEREATALANAHVRAIADQIAGEIELIVRESEALIGRIAARPLVGALDPKRCDPAIREFVDLNPRYVTLAVRDSLGNPVCTYHPDPAEPERVAAFPWFQEGLRSGGFSISGAFFRPRVGRWVSTLTAPVRDESGRIAGLIVLPLDLLHLQQQIMHSLPQHAMVNVLDPEGFFLLRSIEPEKWIGKQGRLPSLPEALRREREGYVTLAGIDGVRRLYAFTTVPSTGWRVFAGLPEDAVFAAHRARLKQSAAIGLLIALLAAGVTWGISRTIAAPVRSLAGTARAIAGGNLATRAAETGAAEVALVAHEINRMLDVREVTETALRESEAKYRQFVERSPDLMFAHSAGRIVLANAAMEELLGAAPGSLLGKPVLDVVAPADRELVSARIMRVLRDPPVPRAEVRYLRLDGSTVPVESAASPIRFLGEPAVLVTARDITQRMRADESIRRLLEEATRARAALLNLLEDQKRVEAALRESETKFRNIIEASPVPYALNDEQQNITYLNAAFVKTFGYDLKDIPTLADWWPKAYPDTEYRQWVATAWQARLDKSKRTGTPFEAVELNIRCKDGTLRTALCGVVPLGETFKGVHLVVLYDITERKQAEVALRAQHAELENLYATTPVGLALIDRNLRFLRINERLAAINGKPVAAHLGRTIAEALPELAHVLEPIYRRVLDNGEPVLNVEIHGETLAAPGVLRDWLASYHPVRAADGSVTGVSIVVLEITERKRTEAALREAYDRLANIMATSPGIVCSFRLRPDGSACFPFGGERIAETYGVSPGRLAEDAAPFFALVHPDDIDGLRESIAESARRLSTWHHEWRIRHPVRGELWIEGHSMPQREPDGSTLWHGVATDIAERKRAEVALRDLSRRLLEVEEAERRAISRELHDRIGQNLSALKLTLGIVREQLPQESLRVVKKRFDDAQELVASTVAQARSVMADLRPPALDEYGLYAALRTHAAQFSERTGVAVEVTGADLQPRLPSAVETALFRIAQEALNNVAKHAHAAGAKLALQVSNDRVTLTVSDEGRGFDASRVREGEVHLGMTTMCERAEAIGAALRVESAPGKGTRIAVEVAPPPRASP